MMEKWRLPDGWEWISIPEVCQINPRRPRLQRHDAAPTSFVPMQSVDELQGIITDMRIRPFRAVKRGYTYFEENDVLMAKITPSMENGKAAIAKNLIDGIGFGSTEFHVFRPNKGVASEWIFYYIRRKSFRDDAKRAFRGAVGQQRVPEDFLYSQSIPIPYPDDPERSLAEQRRIVARLETLLGEVRKMRELVKSMQADIEQVMEAALAEAFPKYGQALPDRWEWWRLGDKCTTTSGGTPRRSIPSYFGGSIPWIKSGELKDSIITEAAEYITEEGLQNSSAKKFPEGTLLIAMYGATVGKLGILGIEAATNQAVCAIFPPRSILNKYLFWFLRSLRNQLVNQSFGGAQSNISQSVIRNLQIPIPYPENIENSLHEQRRIVAYLDAIQDEVNTASQLVEQDLQAIDQLEQSILAAAFRGEL